MGALGKKMRCSGFEEVLIESGICASGLIEQVLTGKQYNHTLRVHKVVYEALERNSSSGVQVVAWLSF